MNRSITRADGRVLLMSPDRYEEVTRHLQVALYRDGHRISPWAPYAGGTVSTDPGFRGTITEARFQDADGRVRYRAPVGRKVRRRRLAGTPVDVTMLRLYELAEHERAG